VSQINPFQGLVSPSANPQRVNPKKDHAQGQRQQHHEHPHEEAKREPTEGEDGKPHVDLKA